MSDLINDLIERLRDKARLRAAHGLTGWVLAEEALLAQAADEIERLTAALRAQPGPVNMDDVEWAGKAHLAEAIRERDELRDLLLRAGFVQCDIPACNCGSWHHRYGLPERMQEIRDALAEAGHELSNANGNLTLNALKELVAERDALKADAERYRWLRGDLCPDHSVRWTQWEVRCWKAPSWTGDLRRADLDDAIDAAIDAARGKE